MKKYILLVLVLLPSAFAYQFKIVSSKVVPNYDINFELELTNASEYGRLDCQSFFKKLDFFSSDNQLISENYISIDECEYIYNNIQSCIAQNSTKCIEEGDILNTSCKCL